LRDVSFEVRQGEILGIIRLSREIDFHQPTHWTGTGPQLVCGTGQAELPFHRGTNGAGKTAVLKMLNAPFMPQDQPVGLTHRPRTSIF
jgi:ABC-type phosphonate transport system ATPase subunit